MDLDKQVRIIDTIHDTLEMYRGQELTVRANLGRSKIAEDEALLLQVHPRLFVVEIHRKRGRIVRQSYQFVDILTGVVELRKNGEPLFSPFVEDDGEGEDYSSLTDYDVFAD